MKYKNINGHWCGLAFVVQMPQVREVRSNIETHPAFGVAWREEYIAKWRPYC